MSIPILFFHYGNARYLKYSLKQARYFNPDAAIYLIGDKKNDKYPFLTHVQASDYAASVEEFTRLYKHRSSNDERYELNCFLRWFYIKEVCQAKGVDTFVYLDSDVLSFQDFGQLRPYFKDSTIANTCDDTGMPAFTYFKDFKALSDFCNFLIQAYTDEQLIAQLDEIYAPFKADPALMGGISDMVLFHMYFQQHPTETLKVDLIDDEIAIDNNINLHDGYETEGGKKKMHWQNGQPYGKKVSDGKLIRFATLHYQGDAKTTLRSHYTAGGYALQRIWEDLDLKARIKRFKRSLKRK